MESVERAKVRLEIDDEEARVSLEGLKSEAKDINKELRALKESGEVGSEAWKELRNRQREVNAEMKEFTSNIDINDASMNELRARSRQLSTELNKLKVDSEEWLDKLEELKLVDGRIDSVKAAMKGLGDEVENHGKEGGLWSSLKGQILGVFTGTALFDLAKEAGAAMIEFGKDIFETTAKFEKYDAVLTNALGSQEKAAAAMNDIKKFAAETPFSVDELTESYVKYVNRGLQPTMEEMRKMGDIASSQGKSFDQLTEAILDATSGGGFERLKEFGIQASKSGDQVELSFKGVNQTVKNTPEAIESAILAFGELEGVAGGMAAISQTLEGRLSNLGDNFDSLKLLLGDGLNPVFSFLLDAMNWGIDVIKGLFTESEPIIIVFQNINEIVGNLVSSFKDYLSSIFPINDASISLRDIINFVAVAFQYATTPLRIFISAMQAGYDGMNAIINKGKELVNFFSEGTFTIDTSATFEKMGKNWDDNMKSIQGSWAKTMSEVHINNLKDDLDKSLLLEGKKLEAAKKRIQSEKIDESKKLEEFQKLNKEYETKVSSLKANSLNSQINTKIEVINKTAKNEEDRVKQTIALVEKLEKNSNTKTIVEHTKTQDKITDKEKKELEKKAKEREKQGEKDKKAADKLIADTDKAEADLQKKLEGYRIKSMTDELARKKAEINQKYNLEEAAIKKSLASQATKDKAIANLAKARETEITKAETDARTKKETEDKKLRDKTLAEEKKQRETTLKAEKALFDAEFSAEVAKARNVLDLTKTNSQAQWTAKRNLLEIEWKYKQQQLRNEAEAEKARIAESISDTEQRRVAMENIDAKLKAKLSTEEKKFQDDKTKLNEAQNKAREENNKKFFDALNSAMSGDFLSFVNFLADKVKNDKSSNEKQVLSFTQKTQQISDVALQGINTLKQLNQKFLESQLEKIKSEKDAQIASWQKQYDSGKIDKTKFETERDRINKDAAAKELKVRKDAFEREKKMNIAAAAINTAQAALKSFAMFGWPIGAIMAALAAVAGGLQIAAIKRQQFSGEKGGVINSLGKIFAQSGSVIPKNAFVAKGDRHGSKYGEAGISMINRSTGEEVGEIEGGEPVMVLSRNTKKNNGPIIDKLLHSSLYKNGAPITMANGGVMTVSGKRMFEDGGVVDNSAGAGITPESSNAMMEESRKSAKDMAEIKQNTAQMRDLMKGSTQEAQKSKFAQLSGNAQIANIASTFYDVLKAHGTKFDDMRALLKELKELVRSLDDSSKGMIKRHDEAISQKVKMYNQKLADQKAWRADEQKHKLELLMLQRYIYAEMQKQGKTLEEIRDKPTGADLLHTLDRIAANTSKSNLK